MTRKTFFQGQKTCLSDIKAKKQFLQVGYEIGVSSMKNHYDIKQNYRISLKTTAIVH